MAKCGCCVRRYRDILRFTDLALLERVAPRAPGWARHLPIGLLLLALGLQIVALAGPTAQAQVPRNRATVVLVIDVSLSMEAIDVTPTRLAAAQAAAKSLRGTSISTRLRRDRRHMNRPTPPPFAVYESPHQGEPCSEPSIANGADPRRTPGFPTGTVAQPDLRRWSRVSVVIWGLL